MNQPASTIAELPIPGRRFLPFRYGNVEAVALSDGGIPVPAPLGTPGFVLRQLSCLLIRLPGARNWVLMDAGFGPVARVMGQALPTGGFLLGSLAAAGVDRAEISIVLVSHIHPDHVDGLFDDDGTPTFPNAVYRVAEEELAFWSQNGLDLGDSPLPPPRKAEMLAAAARLLRLANGSMQTFRGGEEAVPGIGTIRLPGHTPGQVGFVMTSGDTRLAYVADAITTPDISVLHPRRRHPLDIDPERAVTTRLSLLGMLAEPGWQSFTPHFPWPGIGIVRHSDTGYTWTPGA